MRSSIRVRQACAGIALVGAIGLTAPAIAAAEPTPTADPLAQAVLQLEHMPNADQDSLAAARAVLGAGVADVQGPLDGYNALVGLLKGIGIQAALWPSVAPFCDADSSLPLEGRAGNGGCSARAVAHPCSAWSTRARRCLLLFLIGLAPDGANTSGMQLAWFNINTLNGGLVPMGTLDQAIDAASPERSIGGSTRQGDPEEHPRCHRPRRRPRRPRRNRQGHRPVRHVRHRPERSAHLLLPADRRYHRREVTPQDRPDRVHPSLPGTGVHRRARTPCRKRRVDVTGSALSSVAAADPHTAAPLSGREFGAQCVVTAALEQAADEIEVHSHTIAVCSRASEWTGSSRARWRRPRPEARTRTSPTRP